MANAADLIGKEPVHALIVGYPGGGKTGAVAALLNAGFKVRMIDFEKNYTPLLQFTDRDKLQNLDIVTFQDKLADNQGKFIEAEGLPTAFNGAIKMLKHWKYDNPDGTTTDLGRPSEWGTDTVLLTDSLTAMGEAANRRALKMLNRTIMNKNFTVWGVAAEDQINLIKLIHKNMPHAHHVMLAHLQMIGPDTINKEDEEKFGGTNADIKEAMAEILPTRLYPKAITKNLSTIIHKEFSTMIKAEQITRNGRTIRVLTTTGDDALDLKVPAKNVKSDYPIDTGLAEIFKLLGATAPAA